MKEITFKADLMVKDGLKLAPSETLKIDTVRSSEFALGVGEKDVTLTLDQGDDIRLLLIMRTPVDPATEPKDTDTEKLVYKVNDENTSIRLMNHHLVAGYGARQLLSKVPTKLTFTNSHKTDVTVSILIGVNAKETGPSASNSPPDKGKADTGATPPAKAATQSDTTPSI